MRKPTYALFILTYANYQATTAIFMVFLPLFFYLRGYSQGAIGTILAVGTVFSLFAHPFWGKASDRARNKNNVLSVMYLGSAASVLAFYVHGSFFFLLAAMAVFNFFQASIETQTAAVTLEHAQRVGWRYGPIRLAGTVGYSIMALVAGLLSNYSITISFAILSIMSLAGIGFVQLLPKIAGHQDRRKPVSTLQLLRDRKLLVYLIYITLVNSTLVYYYSFFPIYYEQMGATPFLIGLATFASAIPEVVVLLFADKLFDAVGPDWMLLGAGILITARWFLYYFLHNMYLILPVQVLHALTAMPIVFAMTTYVSRSVPPGLRSSGQAMFGLAFFGVARLAGTLLGGWLGERVGVRTMFLYNAMFVAVTTLVFAATSVRRVRPSAERQFQLPG